MFADVIGAAVTAIAAGEATVAVVAAGVAAIGTDLEVVGLVTGNKTLTEVGGVMSLAGGGVGLAAGLGSDAATGTALAGETDGAAGTGATFNDATGQYTASAANGGATTTANAADAANVVGSTSTGTTAAGAGTTVDASGAPSAEDAPLNSASGSGGNAAAGGPSDDTTSPTGMLSSGTSPGTPALGSTAPGATTPSTPGGYTTGNNPSAGITTPASVTGGTTPAADSSGMAPVTGNTAGGPAGNGQSFNDATNTLNNGYGTTAQLPGATANAVPTPPATATTSDSIASWYNSLDKPTQGRIISGLMQAGGQAVGGMFNAWSASQKLALQQQAQNLINQQYNTSVANANSIPTVGSPYQAKPTTAAPVTMQNPKGVVTNGASGLANATPVQQGMLTS